MSRHELDLNLIREFGGIEDKGELLKHQILTEEKVEAAMQIISMTFLDATIDEWGLNK